MGNQPSNALTASSGVYGVGQVYGILSAVLQAVPHSVALLGLDGRILHCGPVPLAGAVEPVGRSVFDVLPRQSRMIARQVLARVAETGEPGQFQTCTPGATGENIYTVIRVAPVKDAERVTALVMVSSEAMPEQVVQAHKMEAIGQLTAGVAHNFNNLLTVILPNLEMALDQAPPPLMNELLDASEAAKRAAELVRQLTFLSGGHGRDCGDRVACREVLDHVLAMCRSTFDPRIRICFDTAESLPDLIASRRDIEQALLNICLNARDALEESQLSNPELRVRATADETAPGGPRLQIRIEDNGVGMDERTRARCFEPFFTTKDVGRGTGLGLASTYGIVAEHDGTIECSSKPGAGTVFLISLPAAVTPRTAAGTASNGVRETILVVDDDDLVRRTVQRMLARAGYDVVVCESGREAMETIRSGLRADLYLLDLSMPGVDGAELLGEIRHQDPCSRILCMTGHSPDDVPAGFSGAVIKPVQQATLIGAVQGILDGRAP